VTFAGSASETPVDSGGQGQSGIENTFFRRDNCGDSCCETKATGSKNLLISSTSGSPDVLALSFGGKDDGSRSISRKATARAASDAEMIADKKARRAENARRRKDREDAQMRETAAFSCCQVVRLAGGRCEAQNLQLNSVSICSAPQCRISVHHICSIALREDLRRSEVHRYRQVLITTWSDELRRFCLFRCAEIGTTVSAE
jgi:hypothetical protein